jgi:hypothetical protein
VQYKPAIKYLHIKLNYSSTLLFFGYPICEYF